MGRGEQGEVKAIVRAGGVVSLAQGKTDHLSRSV